MGCSGSTERERNPDYELFFAIDNREHDKIKILLDEGANINWIFETSSKKNYRRNYSSLGLAILKASDNRGFKDIDILLSKHKNDFSNEGTFKAIHKLISTENAHLLIQIYKHGFGFHNKKFIIGLEYSSNSTMMRFQEACLCSFAAKINETPSFTSKSEEQVWVTIYRNLSEELDGIPHPIVFIFRTGVYSLDCKSAHCKILNAKIETMINEENSSNVRWSITGDEIWNRRINSVSPNLELCNNHSPIIFSSSSIYAEWFKCAMTQPLQLNTPYSEWKPMYKRLNVDIPSDASKTLDEFIEKALHLDRMNKHRI